ncbi:MAG: hypothetical protein V2J24_01810 [Pseudomonadales bacterium]|jgi:uncharacterized protein with NAD-binding domain and iron-sulfur cluster|nr:hypothetical protein [Pseudomonadales bacterium]
MIRHHLQSLLLGAGSILRPGRRRQPASHGPEAVPASDWDFESTYRLHCMPLWVDQALVTTLLPPGLRGPTQAYDHDKWLMYFLYGEQTDVKLAAWPFRGVDYQEATFAVPNLYMGQGREKFSYWVRMYCSSRLPVWLGHLYGYPKELERLEESPTGYKVRRHDSGTLMLEATLGATGTPAPLSAFPSLTTDDANEDSFISFKGDEVLVSRRVSNRYSEITPVAMELELHRPDVPGFDGLRFSAPALTADRLGGFAVTETARWSYPERYDHPVHPLAGAAPQTAAPKTGATGSGAAKPATSSGRETDRTPQGRKKVAILGSGCGAMGAALALSSTPELRARFQLDIYQMGWRCGGKGAAGRNQALGDRIEEHGLHLWAGFYNNAFRVIREVYAECAANPDIDGVLDGFDAAFKPQNFMTMCMEDEGEWSNIDVDWPTNDEPPGSSGTYLSIEDYLHMLFEFVFHRHHHQSDEGELDIAAVLPEDERRHWQSLLEDHAHLGTAAPPRALSERTHLLAVHDADPATVVAQGRHAVALRLAAHAMHPATPAKTRESLFDHLKHLCEGWLQGLDHTVKHAVEGLVGRHPEAYAWAQVAALVVVIVRGLLHEHVPRLGFDVLDRYDLTDFLKANGAPDWALASPNLRGGYDYVFGYVDGDYTQPSMATGIALRGALRVFFSFKGAILWTMQAGMGDTIFAPIYKVLKARGVGVHFFHRVTNLGVQDGRIAHVDYELQVDAPDYDPLLSIDGLDCWPNQPIYDRIPDGERLKASGANLESYWSDWRGETRQLVAGEDYDELVLGISAGSFEHMASELDAAPAWKTMREGLKTTRTFGTQLWLHPDARALGWTAQRTVAVAYEEPLSTWADMSFLTEQEHWQGEAPGSIAYFCGVLPDAEDPDPPAPDPVFPKTVTDYVRTISEDWLDRYIGLFWPKAVSADGRFRTDLLYGNGFADQYFRANVDPSERYVLSVPGSIEHRLAADEAPFDNLFLAGDWVKTNISAGCVEAAMSAGLLAARGVVSKDAPELADSIVVWDQDDFPGTRAAEGASKVTTVEH